MRAHTMRADNDASRSDRPATPRRRSGEPPSAGRTPASVSPAVPETRRAAMTPGTQSWLLDLQRSAGNQATAELLRSPRAGVALQRANGAAPVPPAPAPAPAAPVLSASVDSTENNEGKCGYFVRVRDWTVTNPQEGLIIQEVTRTFTVHQCMPGGSWAPLTGPALDACKVGNSTVHADIGQYWELWTVNALGTVSHGGHDTFSLCSLIPNTRQYHDTTKGTFVIRGEAHFYPTATTPGTLGFAAGAVTAAGGLFSRSTDPAGDITTAGLAPAGQPVTYTVTVTWDSTDKRGSNRAAKRRKTGKKYVPDAAWSKVVES